MGSSSFTSEVSLICKTGFGIANTLSYVLLRGLLIKYPAQPKRLNMYMSREI